MTEKTVKKTFVTAMAAMAAAVVFSGCLTPTRTTVREYDAQGNITKETVTSESVISAVIDSTKSKTVICYDGSWLGYIDVTMATAENPTPTFKAGVGKADKGVLTIAPKHDITLVPDIIRAIRAGDLSLSATGIGSTTGTVDKDKTQDNSQATDNKQVTTK